MALTPKQKEVLFFLREYFASNGYFPTYREVAQRFKFKSEASVTQYLDSLEKRGYINRTGFDRGIVLKVEKDSVTEIPLLGVIAAGQGIEPLENPEPISVPKSMLPKSGMVYALKISGNSMIEDGIADGDVVLIKHQNDALDGEAVVAITENGATLKRYYSNGPRLEPRNRNLTTIYPRELEIRGKFIGLIRKGTNNAQIE